MAFVADRAVASVASRKKRGVILFFFGSLLRARGHVVDSPCCVWALVCITSLTSFFLFFFFFLGFSAALLLEDGRAWDGLELGARCLEVMKKVGRGMDGVPVLSCLVVL